MNTYEYSRRREPSLKLWMRRLVQYVTKIGKDFCEETSIHGFSHIAAPRRHWVERLLWALATALAIWGTTDLTLGQLQRYNENPTVVTLEKDYRSWRFSLPAVTACYVNRVDPAKLPQVIKQHWNTTPADSRYPYYAKFVEAVANSDLFHLDSFQEYRDDQLDVDMFKLAVDVMPQNQLKVMSSEPGTLEWSPVMTEAGVCHVTNSLAIADAAIGQYHPNQTSKFPMTCTYVRGCYLKIDLRAPASLYMHSPYDVADMTTAPFDIALTEHHTAGLAILETRGGKGVKDISPRRRGCLYTDEPRDAGRKVYSTNTCRLSCRSRLAMKLCGCVPYYYFYEGRQQCTAVGMWCLAGHTAALASNGGEKCQCSPQCVYSVFREVSTALQVLNMGPFSASASLKLVVQTPRTRYTREIVFHFQDLVVSFGGATGLFLGASFISFVEILYFATGRILAMFLGDAKKSKDPTKNVVGPTHEMARLQHYTKALENLGFGSDSLRNSYQF